MTHDGSHGTQPARSYAGFGGAARECGHAFVPVGDVDLDDILCLKKERTVARDNCVSYRDRQLRLPVGHGRNYGKRRGRVHEHADGTLSVFHEPQRPGGE